MPLGADIRTHIPMCEPKQFQENGHAPGLKIASVLLKACTLLTPESASGHSLHL